MSRDTDGKKDPKDSLHADLGGGDDEGTGNTGFDYAAFEESLDDLEEEHQEEATDPGERADIVHTRPTLDIQHIPKDDATVDFRELGQYMVVTIRGRINENFDGRETGARLRGKVVFDLTEIDRITSFGVRAWLQMLEEARLSEAVFLRASPAMVNQITMMRNFCGPARIHSLVAPYNCTNCGGEFGVPYDAIEDRARLVARNPLKVTCPQCGGAAELDEDPWVFFALDDQLLEEVPAELQRVLQNLDDTPRRQPIEKSIQGTVTHVRFNGEVTAETRFQRAFAGLEGVAVLDFRTSSEVSPAAVEELETRLNRLSDEVTELSIEGAPVQLTERLLESVDTRIIIRSVKTTVRSMARPLERSVVVDLKRERLALDAGQPPDIDVPWRDDPLEIEGLETLQAAAARLERVTAHEQEEAAAVTATTNGGGGGGGGAARSLAVAGVVVAAGAVVIGLGVLAFVATQTGGGGTPDVGEEIPPIAEIPLEATGDGEWSTGGNLPPSWSESKIKLQDDTALIVGFGDSDSIATAASNARTNAMKTLLTHIESSIPPHFPDEKLPEEGSEERARADERFALAAGALNFKRNQQASMHDDNGHHVVVQYSVERAELEKFVEEYTRLQDFRGMTLARSAPWSDPGLRLVKRASYVKGVVSGDRLLRVGNEPVSDFESFSQKTSEGLRALRPKGALRLTFSRDGREVVTSVYKTSESPSPRPGPEPETRPKPKLFEKDQ